MSRCRPRHSLMFSQGSASKGNLKWIQFQLNGDDNDSANPKKLEGAGLRWRQITSEPPMELFEGFTKEDKQRLQWRWDSSQHGGLIELGVDTPTETVRGRTVKSYFKVWFSFRGAKRLATGEFRVEGFDPKNPRDKEGVGVYEPGGSSNTFQNGEGQWTVSAYDYPDPPGC
jgi:hypothetical protein